MKAAYLTERPSKIGIVPDYLKIGEIPEPTESQLKDNELLIRVKATGLNIDDIHVAEGSAMGGAFFVQINDQTEEKPGILGTDFAGVVSAVGKKVTKFKPGDGVCGVHYSFFGSSGTMAETIVTSETNIVHKPDQWSFIDAAAMVMPGVVSVTMYNDSNIVNDKQEEVRCLVVGASGGLGSALLQILKNQSNLNITAVCGTSNVENVKKLGAHDVFDYKKGTNKEQLEKSGKPKFDYVFDCVGGQELETEVYTSLLTCNGFFVTCVGPNQWLGDRMLSRWEIFKLVCGMIWKPLKSKLMGGPTYLFASPFGLSDNSLPLLVGANVKPVIDSVVRFSLPDLQKAIRLVQSHRAKGRVVVCVDPEL